MIKHADLDIYLRWATEGRFDLTVLFNAPGDIEDYQYFSSEPISIDLDRLSELDQDVRAYGVELGRVLFGSGPTSYLDRALRLSAEMPVHIRLVVDDATPLPYCVIRWETLRHPTSQVRVATNENVRFSRYLSNPDGTPPSPLRLQHRLSALVVVANPKGIEGYYDGLSQLTEVDVTAEVARAKNALRTMAVRVLGDEGKRATAQNIREALHEHEVNLLYLVCHGMFDDAGPALFLENERGNVDKVDGTDLADRIGDLGQRVPTLAVLVSCQSAGRSDHGPAVSESTDAKALAESARSLTASGPALSRAGCAAVVAMQGNISFDTAARFIAKFFKELGRDGIPAHAMALARSDISDEPDWYVPVLYSRLKRGSAWYLPRFGRQKAARFNNLHTRMRETNCTPLVGSGVAAEDGILPTRETVASDWADRRQVPLVGQAQADLASVAQYIEVDTDDRAVPRDELAQYLRSYLKKKHGANLPDIDWEKGKLEEHIHAVGKYQRQASEGKDNYSRLAALELPVFITSAWNGLLEDALYDAGKEPIPCHFEWYQSLPSAPPPADISVERPLVYHLFGTLDVRQSLVLTEDDYFAWLRAWMKEVDKGVRIPNYVKPSLSFASLVFLGYTFDDWEFRMIFQAIKGFEGTIGEYGRHVGVQFAPGALRVEPEAAQEYLERYLGSDKLDVYWGSCREFLEDLEETRPVS